MARQSNHHATRGALTSGSRVTMLVSAIVTLPLVVLGLSAMLGRFFGPPPDGFPLLHLWWSVAAVGFYMLATWGVIYSWLRVRFRRTRRHFALLAEAFPNGVAFLVNYVALELGGAAPDEWKSIKPSRVKAVVIDGDAVLVIGFRESPEIFARSVGRVSASMGTRMVSRMEATQVELVIVAESFQAKLGVLPADVKLFSVPSFDSLEQFVASIGKSE